MFLVCFDKTHSQDNLLYFFGSRWFQVNKLNLQTGNDIKSQIINQKRLSEMIAFLLMFPPIRL
jgi:hypothetical protein